MDLMEEIAASGDALEGESLEAAGEDQQQGETADVVDSADSAVTVDSADTADAQAEEPSATAVDTESPVGQDDASSDSAASAPAVSQPQSTTPTMFDEIVLTPDPSDPPIPEQRQPTAAVVATPAPAMAAAPGPESAPSGDVVVIDPHRESNASTLFSKAEASFRIAKQRVQERFKKDKAGLITSDPELDGHIERFHWMKDNFSQMKKTLAGYQRNVAALQTSEDEFQKYLQEQGIKDPTPVGDMMRALAAALKGVNKSRQASVVPGVDGLASEVNTFSEHVMEDAQLHLKKLDKARITYDAQRAHRAALEPEKEKKAEKFEQTVAAVATAETEYTSARDATVTKMLLVNDHRLQILARALESYNSSISKHLAEGTEELKEAVGVHNTIVADDCADQQILGN
eukprot:m.484146 g.484146  ORF g.484146 m.484146 type:complete len:402 (-) comp23231_c0_seq1:263-1468(-)